MMPMLTRLAFCTLGVLPWIMGCGGQSTSPAAAQATMNAGNAPAAAAGNAATPTPVQPPGPPKPALAPGKIVPALELAKVLDMRKLKFHKEATVGRRQTGLIYALVPGEQKPIKEYLTQQLAEQGWVPGTGPNDNQVYETSSNTNFVKAGGYSLSCSISEGGEPGKTGVMLVYYGNYDVRNLPHPADWTELYGSQHQVMWVTPLNVADSHAAMMKSLAAAGWQKYVRPNTSGNNDAERPTVTLRNQGYTLTCSTSAAPAQQGKIVVQITLQTLGNELPAPAEATDVEYDDSDWKLFCKIPGTIAKVSEYYDQAMIAAGHKLFTHDEEQEGKRILRYKTPREDIIMITLEQQPEGIVSVDAQGFPIEILRESKEEAKNSAGPAEAEEQPPKPILVSQIPLPKKMVNFQYLAAEKQVLLKSQVDLEKTVAAIRESMGESDWKESAAAQVNTPQKVQMQYTLGESRVTITVTKPTRKGFLTAIEVQTEGIDWSEWEK
ncbi:MAG: hypothetical protein SFX18_13495 [Pirellulales bacterium]|nr:hypothetical protein [Pirellulales bacterium]